MDPQNTLASYWINHSLRLQILIRRTHSSGWTIRHISLHGRCVKLLRCTLVWPNDQIEPWYWMNHPFTLTLQTSGNIPSISSLLYIPIEFYLVIYNNGILMYLVGFLHSWTAIDSIISQASQLLHRLGLRLWTPRRASSRGARRSSRGRRYLAIETKTWGPGEVVQIIWTDLSGLIFCKLSLMQLMYLWWPLMSKTSIWPCLACRPQIVEDTRIDNYFILVAKPANSTWETSVKSSTTKDMKWETQWDTWNHIPHTSQTTANNRLEVEPQQ